ncbi:hypothetical protein [Paenibacillus sp. L3-i20]|uniref:hypothetical protein n=1 Tax=Paenibacillus sp. L3-i20 TaxID=2905833 RepID=UPI001EDEBDE8|nr:hypothetical protein [Paenibacillus sp. L3-i20]GKU80139.1 hypothetical protein L3i20_v245360 [Paenibacillus sp. L3-i20]
MVEENLRERANRLKLTSYHPSQSNESSGDRNNESRSFDGSLGPPHANEQWKKFYEKVKHITEKLRQ